jgi:hypothetical protein
MMVSLTSQIFECIAQIHIISIPDAVEALIYFLYLIFTVGKICDKPLLEGIHRTFPNEVFSGNGGSNDYDNARFTGSGWCPSSSDSYLSLDLQKEYHITQVMVMANKYQTKWSESYSMNCSHSKTLVDTSLNKKVFMIVIKNFAEKNTAGAVSNFVTNYRYFFR